MPAELDSSQSLNEQLLQWHGGAQTIEMDAFRLWALAGLATRIRFEGAIWGVGEDIAGAYFQRTLSEALQGPGGLALLRRIGAAPAGQVVALDAIGAGIDGAGDIAVHARLHHLNRAIVVRFVETGSAGSHFLLLRRGGDDDPFDDAERADFSALAPHMMLAFSTCRKLQLAAQGDRDAQASVRAAALIDRNGRIHEADARFVRTLRREWADWVGQRLPDALLNHKARKLASRWRFLGRQIVADFTPVNSLFLVTARHRLPADALTAREWDIARRYAAGDDFRQVADSLQVAPATVRSHLRRVFSKLNVRNKSQLAARLA